MATIEPKLVTQTAKELYIRALKVLPPDVKAALARAAERERHPRAREILGVMLKNVEVAEARGLLVCQDTGTPVYKVRIGRGLTYDGPALLAAIAAGGKQATLEHPPHQHGTADPDDRRGVPGGIGVRRAQDDAEGLGIGEHVVPQDADSGRRAQRDQAVRPRVRRERRRHAVPSDPEPFGII